MTKFVIDQSKRQALDKEKAIELLKPIDIGTTSIKLSGNSFGDGSAQVAADALERATPTLTHLDISDIIASRPEDEAKRTLATIADGLKACKHLTYLDLSDNALGAKGIRAVGDILDRQVELHHLYLCNNGLAADAGNLITQAIVCNPSSTQPPSNDNDTSTTTAAVVDKNSSSTKLETLHFHNNLLETAGAIALAPIIENSPHLADFRFSSLRLGREGAMHICKVLAPRAATTLRRLNLSDNSFAGEAAVALSHCVRDAPFLEMLLVNDTLLCDEGVSRLCHALVEGAPKLEVLDISANEVGPEGAKALARLVSVGRLVDVRAEDNELGNLGAKRLAAGVSKSATIRTLNVNTCEIRSSGALALAVALAKKSTLQTFHVDGNFITPDTISQLQSLLDDKLGPLDDNDEDEDDEDDDEDEDDEDEDEDEDEAATDKAVKSSLTGENVDINQEEERLDDLIDQVKKMNL